MTSKASKSGRPNRRQLLKFGLPLALGLKPFSVMAAAAFDQRDISFYNIHTTEKLNVVYFRNGAYDPGACADLNALFRDWRDGKVYPIDGRLFDLLHDVRARAGLGHSFELISGYRSPRTNRLLAKRDNRVSNNSLHMYGMAADVRLPGCELESLREIAVAEKRGGVGFYPDSRFVHIDIGRVRSW